jgi:hypothetical protein
VQDAVSSILQIVEVIWHVDEQTRDSLLLEDTGTSIAKNKLEKGIFKDGKLTKYSCRGSFQDCSSWSTLGGHHFYLAC